jgi:hypothetical protein
MLPSILVLTSRTTNARDLRTADVVLLGAAAAPWSGWSLADVGDVTWISTVTLGNLDAHRYDHLDAHDPQHR